VIMSTRTPLTGSVLISEQYDLAGVPNDHEQLRALVVGAEKDPQIRDPSVVT